MRDHDWRGLPRYCTRCDRRLEPRKGVRWYGWCCKCRAAVTCACPWWRAPWSRLLRTIAEIRA